ncbi:MAG: cation:proton antiporter, partial [Cellulomonas sp.]|nr:cation:proton antiporter [Cellulomonas sp.]
MSFAALALICLAGLLGPALAAPRRWGVPVVVGELLAGILLGPMGVGALHASQPTFAFLANVGFALVMFVAGSHVPVADRRLRDALPVGLLRFGVVVVAAVPLALGVAALTGTGHAALYAVLMASSSAAVILPSVQNLRLDGPPVLRLLPQVAVADAACIVAVPLAVDPAGAPRAALGAAAVLASAAVLYVVLRAAERRGWRRLRLPAGRQLLVLASAATILIAVAATTWDVRAGHSGAKAVWSDSSRYRTASAPSQADVPMSTPTPAATRTATS